MSCLSRARVALIATTGEMDAHVRTCLACRRALEDERAGRDLARRLQVPALAPRRHAELAAEIMGLVDAEPPLAPRWFDAPKRRRAIVVGGLLASALAAAATVALIVRPAPLVHGAVAIAPATETPRVTLTVPPLVKPELPREPSPQQPSTPRPRDVASVDPPRTNSTPRVELPIARKQHARIAPEAHVVIGAQDKDGAHPAIERGDVELTAPVDASKQAFSDGWIAMRAKDYAAAITAFDRVTSPAFAEEAAYWSVVASRRAGNDTLADTKLRAFTNRFPQSAFLTTGAH